MLYSASDKSEKSRSEDLSSLMHWLAWSHDYFMLILSSIKRWQKDGSDALPGLRLMPDMSTLSRLLYVVSGLTKLQERAGAQVGHGPPAVGLLFPGA